MAKYAVEFIGTFFLVLTVGMTVIEPGAGAMAPVAIGSALMVMVYAGGHVSGAHYNPAVTLAALVRRAIGPADAVAYWIAQVVAGVGAALVVGYLKAGAAVTPIEHGVAASLVAEILFTFALCWVVLMTATVEATEGNSYFGLAIGFTVMVGAYAVGSVSGGAFNPSVAVGISALGLSAWGSIWIYLLAGAVGGVGAGLAFRAIHPEEV